MKTFVSHVSVCITVCALFLVYSCKEEPTPEPGPEPSENIDILEGQALVLDELSKNLSSNTLEDAIDLTMEWAEEQPYVASVSALYNGLEITYKSGMTGLVVHFEWDENGKIKESRNSDRHTGMAGSFRKYISGDIPKSTNDYKATDNQYIRNKKVLVWSAFETEFSETFSTNGGSDIFSESDIDLEIDYLADEDCTVGSVLDFENYGLILLDSHGFQGKYLATKEEVTLYNSITTYNDHIHAGRLVLLTYTYADGTIKNYYQVSHRFIEDLCGLVNPFPESVVFNGSCESTMTDSLSAAFISKGVKTYYGFDKSVTNSHCLSIEKMVVRSLTNWFLNTGESFIPDWDDPLTGAKFEIKGSEKMAYQPPYWQGTFSYIQDIGVTRDNGEYGTETWNINVAAEFDITFTVGDPYYGGYTNPYYFSDEEVIGPLDIQYLYVNNDPGGSTTCEGSCSDEIEAMIATLVIYPDTKEYHFIFAFNNSSWYGGEPCIASCTSGYPHEVVRELYLNPGNWPEIYGPLPTYATFAEEDIITGEWTGPPVNLPDIGTYDNCLIKWKFNKVTS